MNSLNEQANSKPVYILIAIAILVNFSGLFVTIMGPDAALYASISKTMVERNNYLELFRNGVDWLDKPHFPFWVTALFFKIFGFTTWAYKLPAILFMLLGGRYTYLLGKKLYNKDVALWAVLILLTAEHIVLSNQDVRAEPYLTGLIIAGVYHFYSAYTDKRFFQLILGCLFTGCAIMTKGPFAVIPIAGAIAGDLVIKKNWKELFHWRWLIAAVLILICICPEIYALYYQFDSHPEKVIFGTTHVSGIKFFFWDSQFGRFFNSGPIKGEGDPFFFLHTTLWAFLPWSIVLLVSIADFIKKNRSIYKNAEWLTICGSLLTFLVFSASKFQLPHYLNIVFPFFAIITAQYLYSVSAERPIRSVSVIQGIIIAILVAAPIVLQFVFAPDDSLLTFCILLLLFLLAFFYISKRPFDNKVKKIIYKSAAACFFLNLYLNLVFYPALLRYQAGSEAAFWINNNNNEAREIIVVEPSYPLAFYSNYPVTFVDMQKDSIPVDRLTYIPNKLMHELISKGVKVELIKTFENYPVTQLDMPFINKKTRRNSIEIADVAIIRQ